MKSIIFSILRLLQRSNGWMRIIRLTNAAIRERLNAQRTPTQLKWNVTRLTDLTDD
jgi:hypothetical protein